MHLTAELLFSACFSILGKQKLDQMSINTYNTRETVNVAKYPKNFATKIQLLHVF